MMPLMIAKKPIKGYLLGLILWMKMGNIFEMFWRASTHFLINACLVKGGMLTKYAP